MSHNPFDIENNPPPEKIFTRYEMQFLAGIVYAKLIQRYGVRTSSEVSFTREEVADLREMLDEALHALGHETWFEIEAKAEIDKLLDPTSD